MPSWCVLLGGLSATDCLNCRLSLTSVLALANPQIALRLNSGNAKWRTRRTTQVCLQLLSYAKQLTVTFDVRVIYIKTFMSPLCLLGDTLKTIHTKLPAKNMSELASVTHVLKMNDPK